MYIAVPVQSIAVQYLDSIVTLPICDVAIIFLYTIFFLSFFIVRPRHLNIVPVLQYSNSAHPCDYSAKSYIRNKV